MSATTDKTAALQYARMREPCIVFEIHQGMVGRGGELGWLSQYPHESEICFPPVSATGFQRASCLAEGCSLLRSTRSNLISRSARPLRCRRIHSLHLDRGRALRTAK